MSRIERTEAALASSASDHHRRMQVEYPPSSPSLNGNLHEKITTITTLIDSTSLANDSERKQSKTHRRSGTKARVMRAWPVRTGLVCKPRKGKQNRLRRQLEEEVRQLQSKQDSLLCQVEHLYLYKYHLEAQCQGTPSPINLVL